MSVGNSDISSNLTNS